MPRNLRSLVLALIAVGALSVAAAWRRQADTVAPQLEPLPLANAKERYWKGNLHTHSLWSDGDDFPEMIADWYKRHGYDFLALSDHNVLAEGTRWIDAGGKAEKTGALDKYRQRFGSAWAEERDQAGKHQVRLKPLAEFRSLLEEAGRFLLVPGEEITHKFAKAPVHVNAINLRNVIKPLDGANVAETIRVQYRLVAEEQERAGRPVLAFLNHPNFQWGIKAEDMVLAEELRFFEVHNGHSGVRNYGDNEHPSCERLWDIVLAMRLGKLRLPVVYGLATDDAHAYHVFAVGKTNPGRGWIMVRAPHLTAESILRGMDAGDFYASTGVVLTDVSCKDGALRLAVRPEPGVSYKTQFIATMRDASLESEPRRDAAGELLDVTRVYSPDVGKVVAEVEGNESAYRFTGQELYVRAKVVSSKLHPNPFQKGDVEVAWTQPVTP